MSIKKYHIDCRTEDIGMLLDTQKDISSRNLAEAMRSVVHSLDTYGGSWIAEGMVI